MRPVYLHENISTASAAIANTLSILQGCVKLHLKPAGIHNMKSDGMQMAQNNSDPSLRIRAHAHS
jgi:hypothetical protein